MPAILRQPAKRNKYRNVRTTVDGLSFSSKKEANRYGELKELEKSGCIEGLCTQIRFNLYGANAVHVGFYVADFTYRDKLSSKIIIEDVKGIKTPIYRLKNKLMAAQGFEILET